MFPELWPESAESSFTLFPQDSCKEKEMTEDEMVGRHHRLNGHESEQTARDSERQRSLACCSPRGRKVSDTTEQLNS